MRKLSITTVVIGLLFTITFCSPRNSVITFAERKNSGDAAFIKGDYAEAEKQYMEALAIAEKPHPDNSLTLIALRALGKNYLAWGKHADAEGIYIREIAIAERLYGVKSPEMLTPLTDLTWVYLQQRKFAQAETYNRRAIVILDELPPADRKEDRSVVQVQKEWIERKQ